MRKGVFLFLFTLGITCGVMAQDREPIVLPRLSGPIVLDGRIDEPAWQVIDPFPMTAYEPVAGSPPSERTEVRLTYDDHFIYGSIRAYDSNPSGIRMNSLYRDRLSGDDFFVILLDTYNDNESAVTFTMTPAGMRRDASVSNDATGPGNLNVDFNTFWDLKTRVTEEGWFAEVRIPLSSLRFKVVEERVTMGLIIQRYIARKNERLSFPALPASTSRAFLKASLAQKIVLEKVSHHRPVYVTPYGLGGHTRDATLDSQGKSYSFDDRIKQDVGVDIKYGLTNDLTLDLTANTDFAQVEVDDQQVNLTRFSLFFPEKRQFFQERSGIFEYGTGGTSRLFHSRRIGLTEAGQPVPILGGVRIAGRVGVWDVGLLNMQTAREDGIPSENFGVMRLRRGVLNPFSFAGAMVTSRISEDGRVNLAYGLDALVRLFGEDYLSAKWIQSFDDTGRLSNWRDWSHSGRFHMIWERRRRQGPGYVTEFTWSGPDYNPGVGFTQRNDFTQVNQTLSYTWLPENTSPFVYHTLQLKGITYVRNDSFNAETVEIGPEWIGYFKSGADASIVSYVTYEDLLEPFRISADVVIPEGNYTFYHLGGMYDMSPSHLVRTGVRAETGSFFDGWRTAVSVTPSWNVSRFLELSGEYLLNHVRFPDRNQRFVSHIARLRVGTALNTRVSMNIYAQFNSSTHLISTNIRLRYNFREGNDLWIVFNEGMNTDRNRYAPPLPRADNRTFLLKYTHTLQI